MSEQRALVDLVQHIIEESQDEPQFSTREHALMGAEKIRDEYIAAHDRKIRAEAVREAAEDLFWDGDRDSPLPGYDHLYGLAHRIESQVTP